MSGANVISRQVHMMLAEVFGGLAFSSLLTVVIANISAVATEGCNES